MKSCFNKIKDRIKKIRMNVHFQKLNTSELKNSKSILFKMASAFLLLILIPVILIGFVSSTSIINSIQQDTELKLLDTTTQTSRYFDLFTKSVEDATLQISLDQVLFKQLASLNEKNVDMFTKLDNMKQTGQKLNSFTFSNKFIKQLFIIDDKENVYSNNNNKSITYKGSVWYEKIIKGNGKPVWINNHEQDNNNTDYALSVGRVVNGNFDGGKNSVILFDIDGKYFIDILADIKIGKNDLSYIIVPSGKVLSAKGNEEDPNIIESEFVKKIKDMSQTTEKGTLKVNHEKNNYIAAYTKSKQNDWIFVTMVPQKEIQATSQALQIKISVLGCIFVIVALIIALRFSLQITNRLKIIVENMKLAEQGDLTIQLNYLGTDEIGILGTTFNSMITKIKDLINQSKQLTSEVNSSCDNISDISNETTKASQGIAKTIESISSGASDQTKEIDNSISKINELAEKINFVVNNTKIIENVSKNVKEVTNTGIKSLSVLVEKTDETNKITKEVISEFEILNKYLQNINQVTTVLKNIANQTALLSLNASIEADRAGDAGRGFAVVANEVKKLAEQSSSSTKDIQDLIQKISGQTEKTTALMNKTGLIVKEQGEAVNDSSNSFAKINEGSNLLFNNISDITIAIASIGKNKDIVINSINNIAIVSEETVAATQEVSASTEEQTASVEELDNMIKQLTNLSNNLTDAMNKFKL